MRIRRQKAAAPAPVAKELVERDGQWCVLSADGSRSFGCYPTKARAEARLGQVESYSKAGVEELLDWTPRAGELPPVLTVAAVAKGVMPPLGESALPASLERQVPPELRYWKAETADQARSLRDELVERGTIAAEDLLMVDGEPTRVIWKAYVAVEAEDGPLGERQHAGIAAGMRLDLSKHEGASLRVLDGTTEEAEAGKWDVAKLLKAAELAAGVPFVLVLRGDQVAAGDIAKAGLHEFELDTRPGLRFGSPLELAKGATCVRAHAPEPTEKAHAVRLVKDAAAEERYVLGVVLEPDVVDSQGDTYDATEVRKAAHGWMELHGGQLGKQHGEIVTGKLRVLESYVAPVDFSYGDQSIKKGTWLLAIRVPDDDLWAAVKSGSFTGFSIGGTAVRSPEATPAAA